ncbi:uncharacterized protein (TIGR02145 family) [Dysgonomonas alginatilytica]|uniref:Uncharacterized protein (TIGR02145 family) n=1 Tax=Dysgonomonas alginatilytica TaxID=1605892 RepID=A0A2V3PK89_9BACT|nr:FISUMP domain-containing protein [Dysgonomonas alginatilytica]PXV58389.1 uncharacterized protein (TIGR02145 family) [Dysgonomonas alginatilytica]
MSKVSIFIQHIGYYIGQLSLFIIVILFYNCSDDNIPNKENGNTHESDFRFGVITTDATPPKVQLRSGQTALESIISQIQILVFENDAYQYRVAGSKISNGSNNNASFEARLLSSDQPTTIYIIANANAELEANEPQVGETMANVKAGLTKAISTNVTGTNLTMWGSYLFPTGISSTTENNINNIRMLRSVARVDVIASTIPNFQMVSIQAFRVSDNMQIIPDNPTNTPSVTDPSIPIGTVQSINTTPINTPPTLSVAQLYLPEVTTPASGDLVNDATCIVIGGYYAGSSTITYYRLDFNPNIEGHPFGQILRNHRYEFNITYVFRSGYPTAQEAANNISSSMEARVVLWSDYIKHMVFDINNYLGVSESYVTLEGEANSSYDILVDTDLSNYTLTWADRDGVSEGSPSSSLSDDYFQVNKSSDGSTISIVATQENPADSDDRVRFFLISGARLKILATIIQTSLEDGPEPGPGGVIWSETNVDLPYTFADQLQIGKFYQWNRDIAWASTGEVTGWNTTGAEGFLWEEANDPCPAGWRVPTRAELQALISSTGRSWRDASVQNDYPGVWFAPTPEEANDATFENPGRALFFPAGGRREATGILTDAGFNSYYWASDVNPLGATTEIMSIASGTYIIFPVARTLGCLLRCVRD